MDLCDHQLSIVRRPVKHARLRVCEDGSAKLFVPEDFTPGEIESLLKKKAGWIDRQREFFRTQTGNTPQVGADEVMLFGEVYRWACDGNGGRGVAVDRNAKVIRAGGQMSCDGPRQCGLRAYAREYLLQRVDQLSQKHALRYERCFVLSQRTRWGSCSKKRNLSLNWRLVAAPEYAIDYVILHELVHTQVMNHSHRFWVNLRAVCPEHKRAVAWLNANRPILAYSQGQCGGSQHADAEDTEE
jgi:predicted metal-dependent hydrolase